MKHKILLPIFFLMLIFPNAFCQLKEKMQKQNVVAGYIIKDGKQTHGYIRRMGTESLGTENYPAPWQFQGDIRFIPKNIFEITAKIKNKLFVSYSAKDIDGYVYDTMVFESVKYSDMSSVGVSMIAKKMFMHRISDGKIKLFQHFQSPPIIFNGQDYIECAKPNPIYQVGADGKLKPVSLLNVSKELADCPQVVQRFKNNEYSTLGTENDQGNKFLSNVVFRNEVRLMVIDDYNRTCK